eukprot:scaffold3274_cov244-Pinguiococcus_pyrenoidosus.AAC.6
MPWPLARNPWQNPSGLFTRTCTLCTPNRPVRRRSRVTFPTGVVRRILRLRRFPVSGVFHRQKPELEKRKIQAFHPKIRGFGGFQGFTVSRLGFPISFRRDTRSPDAQGGVARLAPAKQRPKTHFVARSFPEKPANSSEAEGSPPRI